MEFKEIAEKRPELKGKVERMEKAEKTAKMLLGVAESGGGKLLIQHLEEMIQAVNDKLLYDKDIQREVLMRERDCWEWLLGQFDAQNKILKRVQEFKKRYE
jgi:hypothetical protein